MKKQFILLLLAIFLLNAANSQINSREYTYITEGYKEDYKKGKKIESGYTIDYWYTSDEFEKASGQVRKFKIYKLRMGSSKKTAAIVLMLLDRGENLDWIFCIPSIGTDTYVWNLFWKEVQGSSPGIRNAIVKEMSLMLMTALK